MRAMNASLLTLTLLIMCPFALAQDDVEEADDAEKDVCVNVRAIRTFDAITDDYVYVKEGSDEHYLFTMQNRCFNLRGAMGIGIKDMTSRVCSDGFGEIVYRDRMGGRRMETCRIGKIERVASKDDAEAIVEALEAAEDDE